MARHKWYCVKSRYGLTQADVGRLFTKQKGLCAIGGELLSAKIYVDHDHTTGKTRGLVCNKHNVGLGCLGDDIIMLKKAIEYLEEYQ